MPGLEQFQTEVAIGQVDVVNNIGIVSLTGRTLVEVSVVSVALADTIAYTVDIDPSAYRRIFLFVYGTLNQDVALNLYVDGTGNDSYTYEAGVWTIVPTITYPSTGLNKRYLLNTAFPFLDKEGLKSMRLKYKCAVAPTSGSLTVKMWGVPN